MTEASTRQWHWPNRANCPVDRRLDRDVYNHLLSNVQERLQRLQLSLYQSRQRAIVVFEGWDAAGKGGVIKRMLNVLDPRGFRVWPIGKPDAAELRYPYLHRFWQRLPKPGELTVFDRSWYGRVLVEHVDGLIDRAAYERAFEEINEFERLLCNDGILLAKIWLEVSPEVQLRRFRNRYEDPLKQWKLTVEDFEAFEKRPLYEAAIDRVLGQCCAAPWSVVPCHQKLFGRIGAITAILDQFDPHVTGPLPGPGEGVRPYARKYFS